MAASKRKKVGVFVCHCGINIGGVVDVIAALISPLSLISIR